MNTPESNGEEPTFYGIDFDQLTQEHWADIIRLYYRIAYGDRFNDKTQRDMESNIRNYTVDILKSEVQRSWGTGLRAGSRLSDYSKLEVNANWRSLDPGLSTRPVRIFFYLNETVDPESPEGIEAKEIQDKFKTEVEAYLHQQGLAVPLGHF